MLEPLGSKRPIDTEEDAAKRQRYQDEQAALGQLAGSATFPFAPLGAPLQQLAAGAQQPQEQTQHPTLAEPGEKRICFPFLNRGMCQFGSQCKFRHLLETHPDAISDRVRTGHTHRLAGLTGDAAAQVCGPCLLVSRRAALCAEALYHPDPAQALAARPPLTSRLPP